MRWQPQQAAIRLQCMSLVTVSMVMLCQSGKRTPELSSAGENGGLEMSTSSTNQAGEILSGDLIPFLSDVSVGVILARIRRIQKHPTGEQTEAGIVTLDVLQVLRGARLHSNDSVDVPFERFVDPLLRVRNGFNQWNKLSLTVGDSLLIEVNPMAVGKTYIGLAAVQVQSAADPQVAAVQQILDIENEQRPEPKQKLLRQALISNEPLLRFYALDAISRTSAITRDSGARMIEDAILSPGLSADAKQDLGSKLISGGFFEESKGADSVNAGIIAVLGKQMVVSRDPEAAQQWMELVSSALGNQFSAEPGKDRQIKLALVRSISDPTPEQVATFLARRFENAASTDEREMASRLGDLWRSAHKQ